MHGQRDSLLVYFAQGRCYKGVFTITRYAADLILNAKCNVRLAAT